MKVLLINPSRTYQEKSQGLRLGLPLGLMYLASSLAKASIPVTIFDSLISPQTRIKTNEDGMIHYGIDDSVILATLEKEAPDIVGVG